ncbi:hypothetical protein BY996DRAFT_8490129 [Phakopsora pachyrhizi]|nr:hypothetical protein BY996DRAFT_8490129 [Phakopsora pachyrhizi]
MRDQLHPVSINVGFHSEAVTSIELMERRSFTAEEVSQALDNCMFTIRKSVKICGKKLIINEEIDKVYRVLPSYIFDHCQSANIEKILQMPNSDLIIKPEWINLQALESTINIKAQDTETLSLILCPFAELPKWAYVDLGIVVDEVCEFMRAIDGNFSPSNVFKNIDPKSSSGFILVYENNSDSYAANSKYPNVDHKLTKNATESKSRSSKAGKVALIGKAESHKDNN